MAADVAPTVGLAATDGPLRAAHDLLLVDLDGVVYLGDRPIDGAAAALRAARDAGSKVIFVTNNAARPPAEVAHQLGAMGVAATAAEVMTSAVAAATELAGRLPEAAAVLVIGGAGVRDALAAAGLRPVDSASDAPVAVLQGFAPNVGWRMLAEASIALRAGAAWVATNADLTLPSPRGPLPGNGSLVAALAAATGLQPEVIGKPAPALFVAAIEAADASRPLVIGDRLDTDIAGARAAELPALLLLSGVSSAADLLAALGPSRPTQIGRDLSALEIVHPSAELAEGGDGVATCNGTRARIDGSAASVDPAAGDEATSDGLDGLRALCALAWSREDPPEMYAAALATLDLNSR